MLKEVRRCVAACATASSATNCSWPRSFHQVVQRCLSMPEVAFLHSRNVIYGCYLFAMSKAPAS